MVYRKIAEKAWSWNRVLTLVFQHSLFKGHHRGASKRGKRYITLNISYHLHRLWGQHATSATTTNVFFRFPEKTVNWQSCVWPRYTWIVWFYWVLEHPESWIRCSNRYLGILRRESYFLVLIVSLLEMSKRNMSLVALFRSVERVCPRALHCVRCQNRPEQFDFKQCYSIVIDQNRLTCHPWRFS